MVIVTYAECDGCGTSHRGSQHPIAWAIFTPSLESSESKYFCSVRCAGDALSGKPNSRLALMKHLHITSREIDILELIALGNSNKEIANVLGLAESTIKNRLSLLFTKIGAQDRLQAVLMGGALSIINLEKLANQFMEQNKHLDIGDHGET